MSIIQNIRKALQLDKIDLSLDVDFINSLGLYSDEIHNLSKEPVTDCLGHYMSVEMHPNILDGGHISHLAGFGHL